MIPNNAHRKLVTWVMVAVRILLLLGLLASCEGLIDRLYCGRHNCYECESRALLAIAE